MKKKSIIAILLTLVMCFSLAGCGGGSEFDKLCDYVVENGELKTREDGTQYHTLSVSIVDSEYYQDIVLQVPATNTDTYESISIAGVEKISLSTHEFGAIDNFIVLNVEPNKTFRVVEFFRDSDNQIEYTSDAESYTRGAKVKLSSGEYNRYTFDSFLDRVSLALSEIGFDLTTLGFTSFLADEAEVHEDYNFAKEFEAKHVDN